jgi:hypothetical protein
MGLKANGRQLHSLPLRARGGSVISFDFPECNKSSLRNIFAGAAGIPQTAGTPQGHLYPSAWIYPQKAGSLSAFNTILGTSEMTGSGAIGRALSAAVEGTGTMTASGQLILAAIANLSAQGALSGTAAALLGMTANLVGEAELSGALSAILDSAATLGGSGTLSAVLRADFYMEADITPFTELSPQSLASAVWASTVSGNTTTGSMGELLLDAGGGSSPSVIAAAVWAELLAANQDAGSFGEAVLLLQEELDKRLKTTTFVALK